jgi:YcaO-like protein with predicted kinase domain
VVAWIKGDCLLTGREVWLPADLVCTPPSDGVISQVDTNGLASGNTHLEALLHGLTEVIERDAVSQVMFAECFADIGEGPSPRRLDHRTLPTRLAELMRGIEATGRFAILDDLTLDVPVPVIRAMIVDPAYPGADGPGLQVFVGYGCHPCSEVAVSRALTEAGQALLAVVQGARDSFNEDPLPGRPAAQQAALAALQPAPLHPFVSIPDFRSTDLRRDLDHVLGALACGGFSSVLAFDLTRRDLGVPVVRVRVPRMASFAVDRNRIGWRCLRWLQ